MTMEAQIARLESKVRFSHRLFIGVLLLVSAFFTTGAALRQDVVRANKFELLNDAGEVVGVWEAVREGSRIELRDSDGGVGMVLNSLNGSGGGVYLKVDDETQWSLSKHGLKQGL